MPGPAGSAQRRLSTSLFTMNGETHKTSRQLLLPLFQKSFLHTYHADLVDGIENLLSSWRHGQRLDLPTEMRRWSWSTAGRLLYGLDVSGCDDALRHEIDRWAALNFGWATRGMPVDLPFFPYRRLLNRARSVEQTLVDLLRVKNSQSASGRDVMSLLVGSQQAVGRTLTQEEFIGHAITMFLAAFETTANTLTWTLFLLDQHPEVHADLVDELKVLGGQAPRIDQLERLPLLDRVLKESMRLLPAVVFSRRIATQDGPLGEYELPAGSRVLFSHYMTHHLPSIYTEPETFRPSRWEEFAPSPGQYLPFGMGARFCIGAAFANLVVKTALATIVPRWRIQVAPKARVDRKVVITLSPRFGIPARLAAQNGDFRCNQVRGNIHEMVDLRPTARVAHPVRRAA